MQPAGGILVYHKNKNGPCILGVTQRAGASHKNRDYGTQDFPRPDPVLGMSGIHADGKHRRGEDVPVAEEEGIRHPPTPARERGQATR